MRVVCVCRAREARRGICPPNFHDYSIRLSIQICPGSIFCLPNFGGLLCAPVCVHVYCVYACVYCAHAYAYVCVVISYTYICNYIM